MVAEINNTLLRDMRLLALRDMCLLAPMVPMQGDFHESCLPSTVRSTRRFLSIHAAVYTTFNRRRPLVAATEHGECRTRAFDLPAAAANLTA